MRRCCTRRDDRYVRPCDVLHDAHVTGRHVDDAAGDEKRRDLARAAGEELVVIVLDEFNTPDSRAHRDTNRVPVLCGDLEARMFNCLDARCDAVVDKWVGFANIFRR